MNEKEVEQYKHYWIEQDEYCLGPVIDIFKKMLPDWTEDYGVFRIMPMHYIPDGVGMTHRKLRGEIIQRMIESGSQIINRQDLGNRSNIVRLWTDRKHEFELHKYRFRNSDTYRILHTKSNTPVLTGIPEGVKTEVIDNMIEAGVKIFAEDDRC